MAAGRATVEMMRRDNTPPITVRLIESRICGTPSLRAEEVRTGAHCCLQPIGIACYLYFVLNHVDLSNHELINK